MPRRKPLPHRYLLFAHRSVGPCSCLMEPYLQQGCHVTSKLVSLTWGNAVIFTTILQSCRSAGCEQRLEGDKLASPGNYTNRETQTSRIWIVFSRAPSKGEEILIFRPERQRRGRLVNASKSLAISLVYDLLLNPFRASNSFKVAPPPPLHRLNLGGS